MYSRYATPHYACGIVSRYTRSRLREGYHLVECVSVKFMVLIVHNKRTTSCMYLSRVAAQAPNEIRVPH